MQLQYKLHNSITAMETSNIKADIRNMNTDDELSHCIKAIGKRLIQKPTR